MTAEVIDQRNDVLLDFAAEYPFDDFHRLFVRDAHALDEGALLADLLERLVDLGTAAVHDDRIDADQLQQNDVAREALLQTLFGHCVAAVLDDHGLAVILANIRQRLGQNFSLQGGGDLRKVGNFGHGGRAQARNS